MNFDDTYDDTYDDTFTKNHSKARKKGIPENFGNAYIFVFSTFSSTILVPFKVST